MKQTNEPIEYQKAWHRLRNEVNLLLSQGVTSIHPIVLREYMDFIEDVVCLTEEVVYLNKEIESKAEEKLRGG